MKLRSELEDEVVTANNSRKQCCPHGRSIREIEETFSCRLFFFENEIFHRLPPLMFSENTTSLEEDRLCFDVPKRTMGNNSTTALMGQAKKYFSSSTRLWLDLIGVMMSLKVFEGKY